MPPSHSPRRIRPAARRHGAPDIDWREFVRALVQYRENQGLTQAEVAKRMKTSQPYVARLEGANTDPRLSTIARYAAVVAGGLVLAEVLKSITRGAGRLRA